MTLFSSVKTYAHGASVVISPHSKRRSCTNSIKGRGVGLLAHSSQLPISRGGEDGLAKRNFFPHCVHPLRTAALSPKPRCMRQPNVDCCVCSKTKMLPKGVHTSKQKTFCICFNVYLIIYGLSMVSVVPATTFPPQTSALRLFNWETAIENIPYKSIQLFILSVVKK